MAELSDLLLVLGVIYALECLVWLPLGALAFVSAWGRSWRVQQPSAWAGNIRGGFVLPNPLPPLGAVVYGRQLPLSVSPDGVCFWNPACPNGSRRPLLSPRWAPFAEISSIAVAGKKVLINGQPFCHAGSESYAAFLVQNLRRLQAASPPQRVDLIQGLFAQQLNTSLIAARWQEASRRANMLRLLANVLLVSIFVVVPLLGWQFGVRRLLWPLLAGVLLQTVTVTVLYWRAHKALVPAAAEERFTWALTMLLAVPTAMRAHDLLLLRAFEHFHPLALGSTLLSPQNFESLARALFWDLHYPIEPLCPSGTPNAQAAVAWSHATWRKTVDAFLQERGLPLERWLAPPTPTEPAHRSYCPRCRTQFVLAEGTCADCGGLQLACLDATAPLPPNQDQPSASSSGPGAG
jgi:hypothetical protein